MIFIDCADNENRASHTQHTRGNIDMIQQEKELNRCYVVMFTLVVLLCSMVVFAIEQNDTINDKESQIIVLIDCIENEYISSK